MKLTAAEKKLVQDQRDKAAAEQAEITIARDAMRQLSDEQVVSIARQLANECSRITGPRPRCTCDSQWTDPNCKAMRAGWASKDNGPCDQRPMPIAVLRVPL